MRKFLSLLPLLMLLSVFAMGQARTITGKVTNDKGEPVPFATVLVKGTKNTVVADANGVFSIQAGTGEVLQVSSAGTTMKEITIGSTDTVMVTVGGNTGQMDEVIVTAQGVKKKPRELGYSVAKLSNQDINVGRSPQLAQGLAGKVSGLNVYNVNNSVDPAVKITLRGYRSMTGNNDALLVLDGVPLPGSQAILNLINPSDIENITVLKGGQAATLYGSAGVNGALIITTRHGNKGKAKVSFNNATNIEQVSWLPQFQDKYGSGSGYAAAYGTAGYKTDYLERMKDNWRPFENQQYGDAYDGSQRIIGRQLEDGSQNILPYSPINGVRKKIWNTGITTNNQVAIEGGTDVSNFRLSIENNDAQGVVPSDKSNRTGVRLSAGMVSGRLSANFGASYIQQDFDRTTANFYFEALNQAAHIPLSDYSDWKTDKFANPNGFYNDYFNNPYFILDNSRQKYHDNNIGGTVDLSYKLNSWLTLNNQIGLNNNTRNRKNTVGKFLYTDYAKNDAFVPSPWEYTNDYDGIDRAGTDVLGSVYDAITTENIINNDLRMSGARDFGDWSTKALIGFNVFQRQTKLVELQSASVVVPDVYNVSNRQGELVGGESNTLERKFGYYANASGGWKDMIFLEGTFRYDFTSRFYQNGRPRNLYSYPYYGFDLSFILTDLIPGIKSDVLNYAKLRGGYNKNGNDNIPLYGLTPTFPNGAGFPFGGTVGLTVGDVLPDPGLKPEFVKSIEVGAELQMLNNRVNLDVAWYTQRSDGQVLQVKVPNSTGYPNLRLNVGSTRNWGYEVDLRAQLVKNKNWNWMVSVRYSYNDNKVLNLFQGVDQFSYGGFSYAQLYVKQNQSFPILSTTAYLRDSATGLVLINKSSGYPLPNSVLKDFGRTIPKHILGWGTSLHWKDLTFLTNWEYRGGNVMFSQLGRDMTFTGSGKWTENRDPQMVPNSGYDDGTGKIVPNTSVNVRESEYAWWVNNYRLFAENFVTKAWFIKLRDISLTYAVPAATVAKTKIFSGISVGLFGRNLITIVDKKNFYTDPEFSVSNPSATNTPLLGINDTNQTPPVRQYGFNINLVF